MKTTTELPLLLNVDAAAAACGLGRSIFYERLLSGEIISVKIGRRRLVPREALEEYVARLVADQAAPSA